MTSLSFPAFCLTFWTMGSSLTGSACPGPASVSAGLSAGLLGLPPLHLVLAGECFSQGPRWLVLLNLCPLPAWLWLPRCLCFQTSPHPPSLCLIKLKWYHLAESFFLGLFGWVFCVCFFLFPLWGCHAFLVSILGLSHSAFP